MSDYERFLELCASPRYDVPNRARASWAPISMAPTSRDRRAAAIRIKTSLRPMPRTRRALCDCAGTMPLVVTVAPEIDNAEWLVRTYCRSAACASTPATATPRSHRWKPRCDGAFATSITSSAPCPTARGCGRSQTFPMRGGVMEATLFFDELTTEVIADGKHLTPRVAAAGVQDQGAGPAGPGHRFDAGGRHARRRILVRAGRAAARRSARWTASASCSKARRSRPASWAWIIACGRCTAPPACRFPETIRMASLTPARILGIENEVGSIEAGKLADLVVLDAQLNVVQVFHRRPESGSVSVSVENSNAPHTHTHTHTSSHSHFTLALTLFGNKAARRESYL